MPKAYKIVRRLGDGRLVSAWIDGIKSNPKSPQLTYIYGEITMSHPDYDKGIFCHRELSTAIEGIDISVAIPCTVEVHEVYPIGDEIPYWSTAMSHLVNYPAVLFGRKVADIER